MGKRISGAKHIPKRTCIACGQIMPKRELIRLVSTPAGAKVDLSSRNDGRGTYLCKARECWEIGLKKDRLQHILKVKISPQNLEQLMDFSRNLSREQGSTQPG